MIELRHKAGEFIPSSAPETAIVANLERLKAKFHLLTEQASLLSVGQQVSLRLSQENKTLDGIIEYIAPVTSAKSLTVRIDVVIENRHRQVRSGVPVRILINAP